MGRRVPWARIVAGILAATAFATSLSFLLEWRRMRDQCARAAATELVVLTDAFAEEGSSTVQFSPDYEFTCKEMLVVELDSVKPWEGDVTAVLEGLRADLVIADNGQEPVFRKHLMRESFRPLQTEDGVTVPVFMFNPVSAGDYELSLNVYEPARPLVHVPHKVVMRYLLCGVEHMAVALAGILSAATFSIGAILVAGIVVVSRRRRASSQNS